MNTPSSRELAVLDKCAAELAKAERIDQVVDLRSRFEAIRTLAKGANQSLEVQNRAAALRIAAERKAGKLLLQLHLRGGDRKSKLHDVTLNLEDLGISRIQSMRWQRQAAISDEQFDKYISVSSQLGMEVTTAGLLRLAKSSTPKADDSGRKNNHKNGSRANNKAKVTELPLQGTSYVPSDLQEAIDHVTTLLQVLSPYANGEAEGLSKSNKRAVLYYLGEIESLLRKIAG